LGVSVGGIDVFVLLARVEKQREEIELSKAIATLMNAKTPEDFKRFKDYVEHIESYIKKEPPSEPGIEAAKRMLINRLTPRFAAFKCSSCHTLFTIDSPKSLDEYFIWCPACHSSPVERDYSLTSYFKPPKADNV